MKNIGLQLSFNRHFILIELSILPISIQFRNMNNLQFAIFLASAILILSYLSIQSNQSNPFEEWKSQYGVSWPSHEQAYRRLIFQKNLLLINQHNLDASQTYKMGVNQFTIYSTEEFSNRFLKISYPKGNYYDIENGNIKKKEMVGDIDWVAEGKVSNVKNQGSCGAAYAYSATEVLESLSLIRGKSQLFSQQQLIDCTKAQGNQGCNGGWPKNALQYVKVNGIATASEYPYMGKDQQCKMQGGAFKISGIKSVSGCDGLSTEIYNSPISVTVDATNWSPYKSGVFSNCKTSINHAVLLVGFIQGNWKVKNTWGASWGESGYIRLAGGNTCGICLYPGEAPY